MEENGHRPTVRVEIPRRAVQDIEQAIGHRLRGLVIIGETEGGEQYVLFGDWMSPPTISDLVKDAAEAFG